MSFIDAGQELAGRAPDVGIDLPLFVGALGELAAIEAQVDGAQSVQHAARQAAQHCAYVLLGRGVMYVRPLVGDTNGDQVRVEVGERQAAPQALVARLLLDRPLFPNIGAERAHAFALIVGLRMIFVDGLVQYAPGIVNAARHRLPGPGRVRR